MPSTCESKPFWAQKLASPLFKLVNADHPWLCDADCILFDWMFRGVWRGERLS